MQINELNSYALNPEKLITPKLKTCHMEQDTLFCHIIIFGSKHKKYSGKGRRFIDMELAKDKQKL